MENSANRVVFLECLSGVHHPVPVLISQCTSMRGGSVVECQGRIFLGSGSNLQNGFRWELYTLLSGLKMANSESRDRPENPKASPPFEVTLEMLEIMKVCFSSAYDQWLESLSESAGLPVATMTHDRLFDLFCQGLVVASCRTVLCEQPEATL